MRPRKARFLYTPTVQNSRQPYVGRGAFDTASAMTDSVFEPVPSSLPDSVPVRDQLTQIFDTSPYVQSPPMEVEDYRQYWPGRQSSPAGKPRLFSSRRAGFEPKPAHLFRPTIQLSFMHPKFTAICHRRRARREVMHAFGKAGGRTRKPRRNLNSNVWC